MELPDEEAFETSSLDEKHLEVVSGPEDLDCEGPYGAERTAGGVLLAERAVQMPHDWSLSDAIANPLTVKWHEPVVRWMLAERIANEHDHRSYPLRQAILVWSVYTTAPWSEAARKGAAYGLLLIGMESHHFRLKLGAAPAGHYILEPPSDFFEQLQAHGGVEALQLLLDDAFEYAGPSA